MFQELESRVLLALVADATGTITINGTSGNDAIAIYQQSGVLYVSNTATGFSDKSSGGFSKLVVSTGGGNDYVRLRRADGTRAVSVPATLSGGNGNDTLIGGEGNDSLVGSDGNDWLDGRGGSDVLSGSAGIDTAEYSSRTVGVVVVLDGVGNDGAPGEGDNVVAENVVGGGGNDQFNGDASGNLFNGNAGNDTLVGGAGNDTLIGGIGQDVLFGQDGNDFFTARETLVDQLSDGPGIDSAIVDQTAAGDPVNDVPTAAAPPAPPAIGLRGLKDSGRYPNVDEGLDFSFGTFGKVRTPLDGSLATLNGLVVQKVAVRDGEVVNKLLAVGTAWNGQSHDFLLVRYNPDGSLDAGFGDGGFVFTDFSAAGASRAGENGGLADDEATAVTLDSQGRIIVVGATASYPLGDGSSGGGIGDFAVARYLPDGTLDPHFGDGGKRVIDVGGYYSDDRAAAVSVQFVGISGVVEDRYLVAGSVDLYGGAGKAEDGPHTGTDFAAIRLTESGADDHAFAPVRTDFGGADDRLTSLAVDPANGNFWLVGGSASYADSGQDVTLAGYAANGQPLPDAQFTFDLGGEDIANAVTLSGRRLVLAGKSDDAGAVMAFALDAAGRDSFVSALVEDDPGRFVAFSAVAVDGQGRGYAVGVNGDGGTDGNFFLHRFNALTLNPWGGYAVTDFDALDVANAVALQPDGKLVAAGRTDGGAALARYAERPLAEVLLTVPEYYAYAFEYDLGNGPQPLPTPLVSEARPLFEDGVWKVLGSETDDLVTITQDREYVTITINGNARTEPLALVRGIIVCSFGGEDTVNVDPSVTLPVRVFGGNGADNLYGGSGDDYLNGEGSSDVVWGRGGNDTLVGQHNDDVLVGGDGNDLLRGDAGRDLLIGGRGADQLLGHDGEDLLIAGFTSHDDNRTAQKSILAEWFSSRSYAQRIANLGGTGSGGRANANFFLRAGDVSNRTVFEDGAIDSLTGSTGRDWFIARTGTFADLLVDRSVDETVTPIA